MTSLSPDQEGVLNELFDVLDVAAEVTTKRSVSGRKAGFYLGLSETGEGRPLGPGGYPRGSLGGKRRKRRTLRGGAACDDWRVRLAVDSAIILAGAAALVGTKVSIGIIYEPLAAFMRVFSLDQATTGMIELIYTALSGTLNILTSSGAYVVREATGTIGPAAFKVGSEAAYGIGKGFTAVAPAAIKVGSVIAGWEGVKRYISNGISAREDATAIYNNLKENGVNLTESVGVKTRAATRAAQEAAALISSTSADAQQKYRSIAESVTSATAVSGQAWSLIRKNICDTIDAIVAQGARGIASIDAARERIKAALDSGNEALDFIPGISEADWASAGFRSGGRKIRKSRKHKSRQKGISRRRKTKARR